MNEPTGGIRRVAFKIKSEWHQPSQPGRLAVEASQPTTAPGRLVHRLARNAITLAAALPRRLHAMAVPKPEDGARTLYAFYDLHVSPITFDFLWFLVGADLERRRRGLDAVLGDDLGGPREWLGVGVARVDPVGDRGLEIGHAGERAASDALPGDLGEQPLDEVEPGARGGGEVQLEAGMLVEPGLHLLGLVGLIVVDDEMQIEVLGDDAIDLLEETNELLGAVSRQAFADHLAGLHVEGW